MSESKNVSGLVSLLNGLQVVRTIKLLRLLGRVDYIRKVSKSRIVCGSLLMFILSVHLSPDCIQQDWFQHSLQAIKKVNINAQDPNISQHLPDTPLIF